MNARLTRQAVAAIPQWRGSCRSSSVFIFHTGQTLLPFLPGDRQRGTAIMPRRPPSTRINCVWGGVGALGWGGPFRMGKRASPPPEKRRPRLPRPCLPSRQVTGEDGKKLLSSSCPCKEIIPCARVIFPPIAVRWNMCACYNFTPQTENSVRSVTHF